MFTWFLSPSPLSWDLIVWPKCTTSLFCIKDTQWRKIMDGELHTLINWLTKLFKYNIFIQWILTLYGIIKMHWHSAIKLCIPFYNIQTTCKFLLESNLLTDMSNTVDVVSSNRYPAGQIYMMFIEKNLDLRNYWVCIFNTWNVWYMHCLWKLIMSW